MRTYRNPRMDQKLNDLMKPEHVVAVMPDGRVIDVDEGFNYLDVHAPEVYLDYDGPFKEAQISDDQERDMAAYLESQGWEVLGGYSHDPGPYLLRDDQFIGGPLEERIREEPGFWAMLPVDISPSEDDPEHESNGGNGESKAAGWIVARKIGSEDEIAARTQWDAEHLALEQVDPTTPRRMITSLDAAMSDRVSLYRGPVESAARNLLSLDLFKTAHFDHIVQSGEQPRWLAASAAIGTDEKTYSVRMDGRVYRVRAVLMPKGDNT